MFKFIFTEEGDVRPLNLLIACIVAIVGIFILAAVATPLRYQLGWFQEPYARTSAENVARESRWFNEQAAFLRAQHAQIGLAEEAVAAMGDPTAFVGARRDEYLQHQDVVRQAKASYNQACARYQAAYNDFFRGSVAPPNISLDCSLVLATAP